MRIVAEAGCNWRTIEEAKEFIRKSKELNLFATKFQCFTLKQCKEAKIPEYLVLTKDNIQELFDYGIKIKQEVFFTPMYPEIIEFLDKEVGVKYFKIRYKDNKNWKIIDKIRETKKQFFISVIFPMIFEFIQPINLYCNPKYPSKITDYLYDGFNYKEHGFQGVSDHTPCTCLLECLKDDNYDGYFEKHCFLTENCLEKNWSISFDSLKEVLKP